MNIIFLLVPLSLVLALSALGAFWWTVRDGQYDDPQGDAERILLPDSETPPQGPI